MRDSWDYQINNGFMTNEDYPYESGTSTTEGACRYNQDKVIGKVTGWDYL